MHAEDLDVHVLSAQALSIPTTTSARASSICPEGAFMENDLDFLPLPADEMRRADAIFQVARA